MKKDDAKYKKEPVKLCFRDRKDGMKVIYLEFYQNGKRTYERIPDLAVLPETDAKSGKANKAALKAAEKILKQRLREVKNTESLEQEAINEAVARDIERPLLLTDWMQQYDEIQKRRGVRETGRISLLVKMFADYSPERALVHVDKNFLLGFIDYLKCGYIGKNGMPIADNTAFCLLGEFNNALNTAVREGIIVGNPMLMLETAEKIHVKEQIMEYLTLEELKVLMSAPCECPIVKQAFLFACNCGLRLSDVISLKWSDINLIDGQWRVSTRMLKTDRLVHIPLPKQALRWLPERIDRRPHSSERVFDELRKWEIAIYLKPWIESAGIKKKVTFHTSRHTYATMLLTLGADIYTVSKLLGHTSIRHTQRYAKVIDAKKDEAVRNLDALMPESPVNGEDSTK